MAAVWTGALVARAGAAQQAPPAQEKEKERTTLSGVYADAQSQGGQKIFDVTCVGGCHNMASHKGIAFKTHWNGRPLWDLYEIIKETMPDDDPGSLSAKDSAALVAYILKLNGLPAGKEELPADEEVLRKIRIELPEKHAGLR